MAAKAKKTATKKKTTASKTKKTVTAKTAKKTAAKKTAARKTATKKAATAARKTAAKKTTTKQAAAKKAAPKKTVAKKPASKKAAPKKAPPKKTAAKKAAPAKAAKPAAKKAAAKPASKVQAKPKKETATPKPKDTESKVSSAAAEKKKNDSSPKIAVARRPVRKQPIRKKGMENYVFSVKELIVYPAHGVGTIIAVENQSIADMDIELYVINFEHEKMKLRVPTDRAVDSGMRPLSTNEEVDKAIALLQGRARIKRTMWSRRAQEYEAKINSGDLRSVAEVVRDLYRSDEQPEQSYSERQLYEQAVDRMAREVAAVRKVSQEAAVAEMEASLHKKQIAA